ncbi:hypothetical protein E2542_SST20654 [Spatholobus suberectus]|nr:hypothetical protein E2542_SST20654 [Spatholobus suberectus]
MPQTTGTQGYDRRAQLLAYSRQLRENARSQKKKRLLLPEPVQICSPSTQMPPSSSTRLGHECVEHKGSEEINGSMKRKESANKCCPVLDRSTSGASGSGATHFVKTGGTNGSGATHDTTKGTSDSGATCVSATPPRLCEQSHRVCNKCMRLSKLVAPPSSPAN